MLRARAPSHYPPVASSERRISGQHRVQSGRHPPCLVPGRWSTPPTIRYGRIAPKRISRFRRLPALQPSRPVRQPEVSSLSPYRDASEGCDRVVQERSRRKSDHSPRRPESSHTWRRRSSCRRSIRPGASLARNHHVRRPRVCTRLDDPRACALSGSAGAVSCQRKRDSPSPTKSREAGGLAQFRYRRCLQRVSRSTVYRSSESGIPRNRPIPPRKLLHRQR